ncbi:MAG: hypothetical protein ACKO58_06780, partial [Cyanobium sp.]
GDDARLCGADFLCCVGFGGRAAGGGLGGDLLLGVATDGLRFFPAKPQGFVNASPAAPGRPGRSAPPCW